MTERTIKVKSLGNIPFVVSEEPQDFIAEGSFGRVIKAYNTQTMETLAAKVFPLKPPYQKSALQQLQILSLLPEHPNLIHCHKVKITSKNFIYIIMEYCPEGSLQKHLTIHHLTDQEIWKLACDFSRGYKILYERGIIHRDIKPSNILLKNGTYKISDFGLAKVAKMDQSVKLKGSPAFMAPELFGKHWVQSPALDMYSFGATLYFAAYNKYPYVSKINYKSLELLIKDVVSNPLVTPEGRSSALTGLLQRMLRKCPSSRLSWQEMFQMFDSTLPTYLPQQEIQQVTKGTIEVVCASNTSIRNLSLLNTDMMRSMKYISVVIISASEKEIFGNRDVLFYLDKLQGRVKKLGPPGFGQWQQYNSGYCRHLGQEIQGCLGRLIDSLSGQELSLFTESPNYIHANKLIQEDKKAMEQLCSRMHLLLGLSLNEIKARLYQSTVELIQFLVQNKNYPLSVYLHQLQKYLSADPASILSRTRSDQDIISRFEGEVKSLDQQGLLKRLQEYRHLVD